MSTDLGLEQALPDGPDFPVLRLHLVHAQPDAMSRVQVQQALGTKGDSELLKPRVYELRESEGAALKQLTENSDRCG